MYSHLTKSAWQCSCAKEHQAAHQLYAKWATMMAHTGADRRNTLHGTALSAQAKQLRLHFQAVSAGPLHDFLHQAQEMAKVQMLLMHRHPWVFLKRLVSWQHAAKY